VPFAGSCIDSVRWILDVSNSQVPRPDVGLRTLAIATISAVTAENTRVDRCVFCSRHDQPGALVETDMYYVMPDRFPLVAGHTLVIARQHTRCYGVADRQLIRDVESAAHRVREFLRHSYGKDALIVENGIEGQTVFHAHLHLIPVRPSLLALPSDLVDHPDVVAVRNWNDVQGHFSRDGAY
jgi:diadenosine tetraphosphate (Ap4A) HIT family hydrolase